MPLFTRSGKTVSLRRPEAAPPERVVKKPRYEYGYSVPRSQIDLPKYEQYRFHQNPSKYPNPKIFIDPNVPVLVCLTFRHFAVTQKLNLSDTATDMIIHYLDDKYPGWDAQIPTASEELDLLVEQHKVHAWKRRTLKANGVKKLDKSRNLKSYFKGVPRIHENFNIPRSVYIAIQSVAVVIDRPMSDVVIEAMMFYFDEFLPGWEYNGDLYDVDQNP